jgi:hypothetical protein
MMMKRKGTLHTYLISVTGSQPGIRNTYINQVATRSAVFVHYAIVMHLGIVPPVAPFGSACSSAAKPWSDEADTQKSEKEEGTRQCVALYCTTIMQLYNCMLRYCLYDVQHVTLRVRGRARKLASLFLPPSLFAFPCCHSLDSVARSSTEAGRGKIKEGRLSCYPSVYTTHPPWHIIFLAARRVTGIAPLKVKSSD